MKQAYYCLRDGMREVGREMDVEEVANIIESHAFTTAISAAASGALPGVGGTIAFGIACTSTITMYGRLANVLGIRLNHGLIKALASAVVADLAASTAAVLVVSSAVSFIPGVGNMAAGTLTAVANFGFVYLAGYIFIKMISAIGVSKMESMSESELKSAAKSVQNGMDMKLAMKEAKQAYKKG